MNPEPLSEREQRVLEAVIRTYVETAEPAGSRTVARRFGLGVSPATVRNTMADLEEKGFLYHPHTSAGRVPTDRAYRYYVDTIMRPVRLTPVEQRRLRKELSEGEGAMERVLRRAAQVLGLLTDELGVAIAPRIDEAVLEKIELLSMSSEKVLLVLWLRGDVVRTIYVDTPASVPVETLQGVSAVLNERLAGQTLRSLRNSFSDRLRDSVVSGDVPATELMNIFLQSAEGLFERSGLNDDGVHLGHASVLANQPEFASGTQLKNLIELTEQKELLAAVLTGRESEPTLRITIGAEHQHPKLSGFTLVTSEYRSGNLSGVIGVIGPTRMPYEKVIAIVDHTSQLLSEVLGSTSAPSSVVHG